MERTSVNFQTVTTSCFQHNDRTQIINYLVRDSADNFCNISSYDAMTKYQELKKIAVKNYKKTVGKNPQANAKYLKEAVVVINKKTTKEQVEKLGLDIAKKHGLELIQFSIHFDEGKSKDDLNLHAHITFFTKDLSTGLSIWRKFTKKQLSEFQDLAAINLGMERGIPAEITGRKHLKVKEFRRQKKLQDIEEKKLNEAKNEISKKELEILELEYKFNDMEKKKDLDIRQIEYSFNEELDVLYESENYSRIYFQETTEELNKLQKEKKMLEDKLNTVKENYNYKIKILQEIRNTYFQDCQTATDLKIKLFDYIEKSKSKLIKYEEQINEQKKMLEDQLYILNLEISNFKSDNRVLKNKLKTVNEEHDYKMNILLEIRNTYFQDCNNDTDLKIKLFDYIEKSKSKLIKYEEQTNEQEIKYEILQKKLNEEQIKNKIIIEKLEITRNENFELTELNRMQNMEKYKSINKRKKSLSRSR